MLIGCLKRCVCGSLNWFFGFKYLLPPKLQCFPKHHCPPSFLFAPGRHYFMGLRKKRNDGSVVSSQRQNWKSCILSKWPVPSITGRSGWWKVIVIKLATSPLPLWKLGRLSLHSWELREWSTKSLTLSPSNFSLLWGFVMLEWLYTSHSWQSIQS